MVLQHFRAGIALGELGIVAEGPETFGDFIDGIIVADIDQGIRIAAASHAGPPAPCLHIQGSHVGVEHLRKLKRGVHVVSLVVDIHAPFAHMHREACGAGFLVGAGLDAGAAAVVVRSVVINVRGNFLTGQQGIQRSISGIPAREFGDAQLHVQISAFQLIYAGLIDLHDLRKRIDAVFLRGISLPCRKRRLVDGADIPDRDAIELIELNDIGHIFRIFAVAVRAQLAAAGHAVVRHGGRRRIHKEGIIVDLRPSGIGQCFERIQSVPAAGVAGEVHLAGFIQRRKHCAPAAFIGRAVGEIFPDAAAHVDTVVVQRDALIREEQLLNLSDVGARSDPVRPPAVGDTVGSDRLIELGCIGVQITLRRGLLAFIQHGGDFGLSAAGARGGAIRHRVAAQDPEIIKVKRMSLCLLVVIIADMELDGFHRLDAAVSAERHRNPALEAGRNRQASPTGAAAPCIGQRSGLDQSAVLFEEIAGVVGGFVVVDEQLQRELRAGKLRRIHPKHEHIAAAPVVAEGIVHRQIDVELIRPAIAAVLTDRQCAGIVAALAVDAEDLHVVRRIIRVRAVPGAGPGCGEQIVGDILHIPRGLVGRRRTGIDGLLLRDGNPVGAGCVIRQRQRVDIKRLSLRRIIVTVAEVDLNALRRHGAAVEGGEGQADPAGISRRNRNSGIVCAVPRACELARKLCGLARLRGIVGLVDRGRTPVDLEVHRNIAGKLRSIHPEPDHIAAVPVGNGSGILAEHQGEAVRPVVAAVLREGKPARTVVALVPGGLNRHIVRHKIGCGSIGRNHPAGAQRIRRQCLHAPDLQRQVVTLAGALRIDIAVFRTGGNGVAVRYPEFIQIQAAARRDAIAGHMHGDIPDDGHVCVPVKGQPDPADISGLNREAAVAVPRSDQLALSDAGAVLHGEITAVGFDLLALQDNFHLRVRAEILRIDKEPQHPAAGPVRCSGCVRLEIQRKDIRPAIAAVKTQLQRAGFAAAYARRAKILHVILPVILLIVIVRGSPAGSLQIGGELFHIPDRGGSAPLDILVIRSIDLDAVDALVVIADPEGVHIYARAGGGVAAVSQMELQQRGAGKPVGIGAERNSDPALEPRRENEASVAAAFPRFRRGTAGRRGVAVRHREIGGSHYGALPVHAEVELHATAGFRRIHPEPKHAAASPVAFRGAVAGEINLENVYPAVFPVLADLQRVAALIALSGSAGKAYVPRAVFRMRRIGGIDHVGRNGVVRKAFHGPHLRREAQLRSDVRIDPVQTAAQHGNASAARGFGNLVQFGNPELVKVYGASLAVVAGVSKVHLDIDHIGDLTAVGAQRDAHPAGVIRADGNAAVVRAVPSRRQGANLLLLQAVIDAVVRRADCGTFAVDPQVQTKIVTQVAGVYPEPENLALGPVRIGALVIGQVDGENVRSVVSTHLTNLQRTASVHAAARCAEHLNVVGNEAVPAGAVHRRPAGGQKVGGDVLHVPCRLAGGRQLRTDIAESGSHRTFFLSAEAEVIEVERSAGLRLPVVTDMQVERLDFLRIASESLQRHADPTDKAALQWNTPVARTGIGFGSRSGFLGDLFPLRHGEVGIADAHVFSVQLQLHGHARADLSGIVPDPQDLSAAPVGVGSLILFHADGVNIGPVVGAVLTDRQRAAALVALAVHAFNADVSLDKGVVTGPVCSGPLCCHQIIGDVFHVPDDAVVRNGVIFRKRCNHTGVIGAEGTIRGLFLSTGSVVRPCAACKTAKQEAESQQQTDHAF